MDMKDTVEIIVCRRQNEGDMRKWGDLLMLGAINKIESFQMRLFLEGFLCFFISHVIFYHIKYALKS